MYKVVSVERQGDSVFTNEYTFDNSREANLKYDKELEKTDVVDVRIWFYTEVKRFVKHKDKKTDNDTL